METTNKPNPLLILRIVWAAIFFSPYYFSLILMTTTREIQPLDENFVRIIGAIALISLTISIVLPDFLFKRFVEATRGKTTDALITQQFMVLSTLRFALTEAVAIYGLILGLRFGVNYYYPFWAMSSLGMLSAFPTSSALQKRLESARFP